MKTNYKGKGEHSVIQLEKIIEERETEISELKKQKYEMLEMISELLIDTQQQFTMLKTLSKKLYNQPKKFSTN
jgi:hypothetical protein